MCIEPVLGMQLANMVFYSTHKVFPEWLYCNCYGAKCTINIVQPNEKSRSRSVAVDDSWQGHDNNQYHIDLESPSDIYVQCVNFNDVKHHSPLYYSM